MKSCHEGDIRCFGSDLMTRLGVRMDRQIVEDDFFSLVLEWRFWEWQDLRTRTTTSPFQVFAHGTRTTQGWLIRSWESIYFIDHKSWGRKKQKNSRDQMPHSKPSFSPWMSIEAIEATSSSHKSHHRIIAFIRIYEGWLYVYFKHVQDHLPFEPEHGLPWTGSDSSNGLSIFNKLVLFIKPKQIRRDTKRMVHRPNVRWLDAMENTKRMVRFPKVSCIWTFSSKRNPKAITKIRQLSRLAEIEMWNVWLTENSLAREWSTWFSHPSSS